ncbi:MAG: protein-disulfide reductase DsbD domain-containing protein, partial [Caulobacteraceae bacterium]
MRRFKFQQALGAALLALALLAPAARAQTVSLGPRHVQATLAAETDGAAPGSTLYVAVVEKIERGWHTYWLNPGDAGEPTSVAWTLPAGWRAGAIVWPPPRRLPVGPLMNYGYEGEAVLAVPLEVPADARPGQIAHLAANVSMLVCADVCVPEAASLVLDTPVVAVAPPPDPTWGRVIARALADAPKSADVSASYQLSASGLSLAMAGPALAGVGGAGAYFFPETTNLIQQAQPEKIDLGARGLTLTATPGALLKQGPVPGRISGVLETADGRAFQIEAAAGPPPPGSGGLGPPAKAAS